MRSKIASFIMFCVILLTLAVFGVFGFIIWEEIGNIQKLAEPEKIQTVLEEPEEVANDDIKVPQIIEHNSLNDIVDYRKEEVNYNEINVDKYFFNQLEEYSKIMYKAFEANEENMKTGTYKVEFGTSFSSILDKENGQDELGKYYQSAIEAYIYDNPEIFYLSPNKMYLNIETTTRKNKNTYYVYMDCGKEQNYLVDEFSSKEQINQALLEIEQIKNELVSNRSGDRYQDIKRVHDYLVENISYDTSLSKPNIYNVYGALVNKEAVCEGYARSFKYIMDEMGIPCTLTIGKGKNSEGRVENHAWNYVELNGNWYAIDATWDDPIVIGGGNASRFSKYKYFLKGSNTMQSDHIPSGQFTQGGKEFNYPVLSNNDWGT